MIIHTVFWEDRSRVLASQHSQLWNIPSSISFSSQQNRLTQRNACQGTLEGGSFQLTGDREGHNPKG